MDDFSRSRYFRRERRDPPPPVPIDLYARLSATHGWISRQMDDHSTSPSTCKEAHIFPVQICSRVHTIRTQLTRIVSAHSHYAGFRHWSTPNIVNYERRDGWPASQFQLSAHFLSIVQCGSQFHIGRKCAPNSGYSEEGGRLRYGIRPNSCLGWTTTTPRSAGLQYSHVCSCGAEMACQLWPRLRLGVVSIFHETYNA